jgi:hypothetical protein
MTPSTDSGMRYGVVHHVSDRSTICNPVTPLTEIQYFTRKPQRRDQVFQPPARSYTPNIHISTSLRNPDKPVDIRQTTPYTAPFLAALRLCSADVVTIYDSDNNPETSTTVPSLLLYSADVVNIYDSDDDPESSTPPDIPTARIDASDVLAVHYSDNEPEISTRHKVRTAHMSDVVTLDDFNNESKAATVPGVGTERIGGSDVLVLYDSDDASDPDDVLDTLPMDVL